MKVLKFIWLLIKMIILGALVFNFVPALCIGYCFLKGTLHTIGYGTPYAVGWSIQGVLVFIYCIKDIMNPKIPT